MDKKNEGPEKGDVHNHRTLNEMMGVKSCSGLEGARDESSSSHWPLDLTLAIPRNLSTYSQHLARLEICCLQHDQDRPAWDSLLKYGLYKP